MKAKKRDIIPGHIWGHSLFAFQFLDLSGNILSLLFSQT
jgi:hypothetical protein